MNMVMFNEVRTFRAEAGTLGVNAIVRERTVDADDGPKPELYWLVYGPSPSELIDNGLGPKISNPSPGYQAYRGWLNELSKSAPVDFAEE